MPKLDPSNLPAESSLLCPQKWSVFPGLLKGPWAHSNQKCLCHELAKDM